LVHLEIPGLRLASISVLEESRRHYPVTDRLQPEDHGTEDELEFLKNSAGERGLTWDPKALKLYREVEI
jgi:hypothetical protein